MSLRILASGEGSFPGAAAWDALVAQDPRGHLLQTWAWGELKGAFGWTPVRLALERDGALVAGAQLLFRQAGPFSVGYLPKGPVLAEEDETVTAALWRAIHKHARKRRAISLKVEPEWRDEDRARHQWLIARGLVPSEECIQPRRTIIVDLRPEPEEMLARMKQKWRYNVRLAQRKGIEVREGALEDVVTFHRLMGVTGERDRFAVHSLAYYRRAWELFAPLERVRLLLASYQGVALAGLMVYAFNGQSWYMYGASADFHRELMPNHLLQWCAMQWAREQGCTQYDLWGIPDADTASPTAVLEGVQRFKEGFGGEVVRYVGAYDYVYSRPLNWTMRQAWRLRRARAGTGG